MFFFVPPCSNRSSCKTGHAFMNTFPISCSNPCIQALIFVFLSFCYLYDTVASQGLRVFSGDLSSKAVDNLQKNAAPNATFSVCDVSNPEHVTSLVEQARAGAQESDNFNLTLYNRFFMHALDEAQELAYLEAVSSATKRGDTLYMEYSCSLDAPLAKEHGKGHYRRYIETKKLVELLERLDFSIKYEITGQGMAKYKGEDPFVSRIICERN